tara:strand:+ start:954 stop:1721 length:768 start_codon:yes stop_codon:yes gene_type:complete
MKKDPIKHIELTRNTEEQKTFYQDLEDFLSKLEIGENEKFSSFPVFSTRQAITTFLERYHIYNLIKDIPGSIIECGVGSGMGLMSFMHFCSIFEPYHYTRKVYGFDTFEGFTGITDKDLTSKANHLREGGLNFGGFEMIKKAISLHDKNRVLGNISKVELIKGDISSTLPVFIDNHPELVVALLYLDLDLFKPTIDSINLLKNRIPKSGIICFDEINHADYPGETIAVMEALGLENLELKRFPFASMMSYAIVGN